MNVNGMQRATAQTAIATTLCVQAVLRADKNDGYSERIRVWADHKGPFIATQLNITQLDVELSCVAIDGPNTNTASASRVM